MLEKGDALTRVALVGGLDVQCERKGYSKENTRFSTSACGRKYLLLKMTKKMTQAFIEGREE